MNIYDFYELDDNNLNKNNNMVLNSYLSNNAKYITFCGILIAVSLGGDYIINSYRQVSLSSRNWLIKNYSIALIDNLTHGLIGGFSWLLICVCRRVNLNDDIVIIQSLLCLIIASAIDIDHVIAAKSFDIKLITHLDHRPFFHCTTLVILISLIIVVCGIWFNNWFFYVLGWMFLTATFTHHLRDAIRRGFWLSPFILKTKPIPIWLFVIILAIYPITCSWLMDVIGQLMLQKNVKYKLIQNEVV